MTAASGVRRGAAVLRSALEVDVLEIRVDRLEAVLGLRLAVDVDQRLAADQPRRQHRVALLVVRPAPPC